MLAVLDPLLFAYDSDEGLVEARLDDAARVLLRHGGVIPDGHSWERLYTEHIRPLAARVSRPRVRTALDSFRHRVSDVDLPSTRPGDHCAARELDLLFPAAGLTPNPWRIEIETLLLRCVRSSQDTVLMTPLVESRNAVAHRREASVLVEKTAWHVEAVLAGSGVRRVPCIRCERNLRIGWTCRYDESLPAAEDGADCPFCPVDDWQNPSEQVERTRRARPAFRDRYSNAWIGRAHV